MMSSRTNAVTQIRGQLVNLSKLAGILLIPLRIRITRPARRCRETLHPAESILNISSNFSSAIEQYEVNAATAT